MQKISITVTTLDGDNNFVPHTGLEQSEFTFVLSSDGVTEVDFTGFEEVGNGNYNFWGFDVPTADPADPEYDPAFPFGRKQVKVKINGTLQPAYGNITVYADNDEPASTTYSIGRVHRFGDTMFSWLSYDPANWVGGSYDPALAPDPNNVVPYRKWIKDNFVGMDGTGAENFVTKNTAQSITGAKTCYDFAFDVGTNPVSSPKFSVKTASNPINGGITALSIGYGANNKPDINLHNSTINIDGTATANRLKIKTTAPSYINPSLLTANDYMFKKATDLLYEPLAGGFNSNTIIVDPNAPVVLGKQYPNITDAINDITASLTVTDRYTLYIKQPATGVYTEDVAVPDWLNIIGEGQIKIFGQLTRVGASVDITSKLQNLFFYNNLAFAHDVDRFFVQDCVFEVNGDVVLTDSVINNSGFYGSTVLSNGGNKITNCYGNYNVTWGLTDKPYNYSYYSGDSYIY